MQYDLAGNRTKLLDPRGSWADIDYIYDGANRLVQIDQPTGTEDSSGSVATNKMFYDGAGFLIKQVDPRGEAYATTYERDFRGREIARHVAGGTANSIQTLTWTTRYDAVGNIIEEVDARGSQYKTSYEPDVAGQPLSITRPVLSSNINTVTETYRYDASGNLLRMEGIGGSDYVTTFDYDARGRMIRKTDPVGDTQTIVYDRFDNVIEKRDYLGTSKFAFDRLNRLRRTEDALGNQVQYVYSSGGLSLQTISARGFASTTNRDRLGRTVETVDAKGGREITQYDAAGNPFQFTDKAGTVSKVVT